ncbi:MAG: tRNA (adenosine(37)-N6)-threonylcarbamoyltransferase complex dimerization subunit type 1 TsaB [Pseudomonadota bacterium]
MSVRNLLCIDASSNVCSLAAQSASGVFSVSEDQAGSHASSLMALLDGILEDAQLSPEVLDGIVYGCGPGSFTGVRIGIALAQGLAHGAQIKMLPVSSLRNIAQQWFDKYPDDDVVDVAIDARMGEWYVSRCTRDARGIANTVGEEVLAEPGPWLSTRDAQTPVYVGIAALDDAQRQLAQVRKLRLTVGLAAPSARTALAIAQTADVADWHAAETAAASYVRDKVAQTIAERETR